MEQTVLFEEKIVLSPRDMNYISKNNTIDKTLLKHLSAKLEGRCSKHGFVVPGSLQILSRSMGSIENGTYTGNILFHVQTQGRVYNPVNGTRLVGTIEKHNKMGLYIIYKNSIRVLIPRDLHIGNVEFDQLVKGDTIEVELRKSRFQIHDPFILSVGVYVGRAGAGSESGSELGAPVVSSSEEVVESKQVVDVDADVDADVVPEVTPESKEVDEENSELPAEEEASEKDEDKIDLEE